MGIRSDSEWIEFRPRRSTGRIWVAGTGLFILAVFIVPFLSVLGAIPIPLVVLFTVLGVVVSAPILVIAWYVPSMRYWIGRDELVLSFGPLLNDRVPLAAIKSVRRRSLRITPFAAVRFPGLAVFDVAYMGVGTVRMCSTSATRDILLIDTGTRRYGLTPADEMEFLDVLVQRSGPDIRILEGSVQERTSTGTGSGSDERSRQLSEKS